MKQIINYAKSRILVNLLEKESSYGQEFCRELELTFSHTNKLLFELENEGLITSEKVGRTKYVKLTRKGDSVAIKLKEIATILK